MEVEKNDVDISQLFNWGKVFEIEGQEHTLIYMKLLGDADVNRARVYALRKSAELRRKLMDLDSDERIATIHSIEELEVQDLVNYILVFSMREITNVAIKEAVVPTPKAPKSNAKLSALEKYQKELDEYPEKRKAEINKIIQREVKKLQDYLNTETKEVLYKKYVSTLIAEFCENEALKAYSDMEVYLGCFADDSYTERFFKDKDGSESFEVYNNLQAEQKALISAAYHQLSIGLDNLKKLREVTR